MSAGQAGYDSNRLPWLNDTAPPVVQAPRKSSPLTHFLGGVGAALLIAGASYWVGLRSILQMEPEPAAETSVSLPRPADTRPAEVPAAPQANAVERPAMPQVVLVPQPAPVIIRQAAPVQRTQDSGEGAAAADADGIAADESAAAESAPPVSQPQVQPAPVRAAPLTLWPADQSEGASGRAIRIGTYSSRLQAKRAWRKLVRLYPGMGRLKAVVAPAPSVRNGKTYYRLQFGTTSHAHSAVLCQRMRIVGQSCVVIGTPQGSGAAAT